MRVLITGATGFAGRHLASLCASEGCSVTGIGRRAATDVELSADLAGYEAIDLTDPEQTDDMVRSAAPERVFHLAADASVASSWNNPARVITNNICSTLNLLEAVRRHGTDVRLLVACSGEEYGEPEKVPVTEDHPLKPKNPYAVSKASLDLTAGFYADTYGMHVVRTRAFNHAGPGQSDSYVVSNLAHQIAEAEATHENEAVAEMLTGNPDVRRDFTDVRDVVRAYWLALERAEAGVYNVCSGRAATITEILAGLASNSPLEVERRTDPSRVREHDVLEVRGSHERLTEATGWKPEIPLEQTLRDTLDWWRAMLATGVPT